MMEPFHNYDPKMTRFNISRRQALQGLTFAAMGLVLRDTLAIQPALADPETTTSLDLDTEKYHVFIPYVRSRTGGKQEITLRSGEKLELKIPARTTDNTELPFQLPGRRGEAIAIAHTLYRGISDEIKQELNNTAFIQEESNAKCQRVYKQLENARYINDLTSLQLLDYVINTSRLEDSIKDRYLLASTNSRLLGIENTIESALEASSLSQDERQLLRGTFQSIRAGEPITDFKALTRLDSIITTSQLPFEIQQEYSISSAKSRALTVDLIIVKWIDENPEHSRSWKDVYLKTYQEIRDGKDISEPSVAKSLDSLIMNADIPNNAKAVYAITRQNNVSNDQGFDENLIDFIEDFQNFKDIELTPGETYRMGSSLFPQATRVLAAAGVETAAGVTLSSLSGAAATNATLAALGGGSVAAGGLGMLGGLVVATGGAALIGAAGLFSLTQVLQMRGEELKNLGISLGTGTIAGAATVLAAWTAASTLGVAGTLSGAAAISTMMAALGGITVMTGGAALVASGTAFLVWSVLQGNNSRDSAILGQLETRTYTLTEDPQPGSLGDFLVNHIPRNSDQNQVFTSPQIPLDKLANALSSWVELERNEKVLALVDSSFWNDAKKGVVFTNTRIQWKASGEKTDSTPYKNLLSAINSDMPQSTKSGISIFVRNAYLGEKMDKYDELINLFYNKNNREWVYFLSLL